MSPLDVAAVGADSIDHLDQGAEMAHRLATADKLRTHLRLRLPITWQRGANENTNGPLREYFPKGPVVDKGRRSCREQLPMDFVLR